MTLDGIIFMESSGVIREAFRAKGLNVYSCDLLPANDGSPHHFQGDARAVIREHKAGFYGFHPPCTYICGSGLHWNDRGRGWEKTDAALGFVLWCMAHKETPFYLENPVGLIGTMIRPPDQIIQPYEFGEDASKATCLWLNRLPRLRPTKYGPARGMAFPVGRPNQPSKLSGVVEPLGRGLLLCARESSRGSRLRPGCRWESEQPRVWSALSYLPAAGTCLPSAGVAAYENECASSRHLNRVKDARSEGSDHHFRQTIRQQ